MEVLYPGTADPYAATTPDAVAALYGVAERDLRRWIDEGLPTTDGLVDPMVCCNWLSWGRLDRCPVLARRWRSYLACFEPHRAGRSEAWRVTWSRRHRLHLPHPVSDLRWWLPDPIEHAGQAVLAAEPLIGPDGASGPAEPGGQVWRAAGAAGEPTVVGTSRVSLTTRRVEVPDGDRRTIRECILDLVSSFRYGYRRHDHGDRTGGVTDGTCLDCALALRRRLEAGGRECRLMAGVIARDAIANAHYWLEVASAGGRWVPVDPTLPAIARMLDRDWVDWVDPYLGAVDARRIVLHAGGPWAEGWRRHFVSAVPGEAEAIVDGAAVDLWPCIDWVCGRTAGAFDVTPAA